MYSLYKVKMVVKSGLKYEIVNGALANWTVPANVIRAPTFLVHLLLHCVVQECTTPLKKTWIFCHLKHSLINEINFCNNGILHFLHMCHVWKFSRLSTLNAIGFCLSNFFVKVKFIKEQFYTVKQQLNNYEMICTLL